MTSLVYSHECGLSKPDPRAYALVCSRLGVEPAQTVLLDDHGPNVDGARQAGLARGPVFPATPRPSVTSRSFWAEVQHHDHPERTRGFVPHGPLGYRKRWSCPRSSILGSVAWLGLGQVTVSWSRWPTPSRRRRRTCCRRRGSAASACRVSAPAALARRVQRPQPKSMIPSVPAELPVATGGAPSFPWPPPPPPPPSSP